MNAASIDRKINGYLSILSIEQKKALLILVKAFVSSNQHKVNYQEKYSEKPLIKKPGITNDLLKASKTKKHKVAIPV